jgi:hypothetical protein
MERAALALVDRSGGHGRRELRLGDRPRKLPEPRHRHVALRGKLGERRRSQTLLELVRRQSEGERDARVEGAAHPPHADGSR